MRINNIFILLIILFQISNLNGQITLKGNFNLPPGKYAEIELDKTKQNIYYNYTHLTSPNDDSKIKSSIVVLQIGGKISKFVDVNTLKTDSLQKKHSVLKTIGSKEANQQINIKRGISFKKSVFKNYQNNYLTTQGKILSTKYEYEEKIPKLNWKLTENNKSILNYKVKKAVVNYGGRNWIAWYTEEIPINLGPYVFGNLPGLILELYDDKKNFHFTAIGIDNEQKEIYKRIEKKIVKTSKKDFFKAERNFHEKPEIFLQNDIVRGVGKFKKIPYNPIEIID